MIKRAFKRLWDDKRGNALIIVGASLPLVFGSAGLATDTVQWALSKRQLQRAADSAAMAGVYAIKDGKSHVTAVAHDLQTNDHAGKTSPETVTFEATTAAGYTNAVGVGLTLQRALPFSSMFMTSAALITANAKAAIVKQGNYCVIALNNTSAPSVVINGNITVNMGCGIISNSTNMSAAISVSGNAHVVNATPIAAVGTVPPVNGTNEELSYQLKQSDPYAGKYSTDLPGTTCKTLAQHVTSTTGAGYKVINPGCYKRQGNGNNAANSAFSTSNEKIALNPGTYYIDSADFEIGANSDIIVNSTVATEGVTIILTGSTPGAVRIDANAEIKLRAPSTGAYSKMLFIQKSGATAGSLISGNVNSTFDGAFYFPTTTVDYNGGAASTFKCAMIVGYIVNVSGNSSIQNNTTGCYANTQESIERVRLIA